MNKTIAEQKIKIDELELARNVAKKTLDAAVIRHKKEMKDANEEVLQNKTCRFLLECSEIRSGNGKFKEQNVQQKKIIRNLGDKLKKMEDEHSELKTKYEKLEEDSAELKTKNDKLSEDQAELKTKSSLECQPVQLPETQGHYLANYFLTLNFRFPFINK